MEPGAVQIATKLAAAVIRYQDARGEYAEVQKAEIEARFEGTTWSNQTSVTGRKHDGDYAALPITKESIDLKAKVDIEEKWCWFYSTLLENQIYINVEDCP